MSLSNFLSKTVSSTALLIYLSLAWYTWWKQGGNRLYTGLKTPPSKASKNEP